MMTESECYTRYKQDIAEAQARYAAALEQAENVEMKLINEALSILTKELEEAKQKCISSGGKFGAEAASGT
jgi:hypothetical protein